MSSPAVEKGDARDLEVFHLGWLLDRELRDSLPHAQIVDVGKEARDQRRKRVFHVRVLATRANGQEVSPEWLLCDRHALWKTSARSEGV